MQERTMDDEYDYGVAEARIKYENKPKQNNIGELSAMSDPNSSYPIDDDFVLHEEEPLNTEEALMDLVQLEELHTEAERKKAIGNKHMASQEYLQAYHAYSAALQLSPVGPSSHVFLSNRAAALLSLKKYPAAATDARRAIALAPTFGKAHARLGQALYFLKDYDAAVQAYEVAIRFEPDNDVTKTYLEKAKSKLEKQKQRKLRQTHRNSSNIDETSSMSVAESTQLTVQNSVATDPHAAFSILKKDQYMGVTKNSDIMKSAAAGSLQNVPKSKELVQQRSAHPQVGVPSSTASVAASAITMESEENQQQLQNSDANKSQVDQSVAIEEDPEFEEALRLQQRANKFLIQKQYRAAIEEYTAALFLVPDDPNLSPDLHLGRAHALNGSRRHESARNDAVLAVKLNPTPTAYSTLAKSLFYMREYAASIDAFEKCMQLLPPEESLGLFDRAYLEKATKALADEDSKPGDSSVQSKQSAVPRLAPPRFVPREEALQSQAPSLRPMPKQWPQQPATQAPQLKCGVERKVVFLSEALGVKLNRGSDGIVRVLGVTPASAGSAVVRQGDIEPGDIVREAAGVDIRRPITNIMWGDTVALIKMAPRPISFLVAKELSPIPHSVAEEISKREHEESQSRNFLVRPSNASGNENISRMTEETNSQSLLPLNAVEDKQKGMIDNNCNDAIMDVKETTSHDDLVVESGNEIGIVSVQESNSSTNDSILQPCEPNQFSVTDIAEIEVSNLVSASTSDNEAAAYYCSGSKENSLVGKEASESQNKSNVAYTSETEEDEDIVEVESATKTTADSATIEKDVISENEGLSPQDEEERIIGGEILFARDSSALYYSDWDTLRWMAYSGARKVSFSQQIHRQYEGEKNRSILPSFWKTGGKRYESRTIVIYENPSLIMILRRPHHFAEVNALLGLPEMVHVVDTDDSLEKYWVLESAADPALCKLRLSPLTTITSLPEEKADDRERSCFQLITPNETISLSCINEMCGEYNQSQSFNDSAAYLETLALETSITTTLFSSRSKSGLSSIDGTWKHQIVIGTLHSIVLSGNIKALDDALSFAINLSSKAGATKVKLPSRVVDVKDENGFTPLYYAVKNKMATAVQRLVDAGADVTNRIELNNETLYHMAARNLDDQVLRHLFSTGRNSRPAANYVDNDNRTPMYVAATEGSMLDNGMDPSSLRRCLTTLRFFDGHIVPSIAKKVHLHPITYLSSIWFPDNLQILFDFIPFEKEILSTSRISIGALYLYPIHSILISMRKQMLMMKELIHEQAEKRIVRCLLALFEHGFEPNERIEYSEGLESLCNETSLLVGFSPLQIVGLIAHEIDSLKDKIGIAAHRKNIGILSNVAETLVANGARMSLDPPPLKRSRKAGQSNERSRRLEILNCKMDADKRMVLLLGGEKRISQARKKWESGKVVEVSSNVQFVEEKVIMDDSVLPGGNDSSSCAICWSVFGFINRKHRCRITGRFVCDECSYKRVSQNGIEHRVSDGQFLYLRVVRESTLPSASISSREGGPPNKRSNADLNDRLNRLELDAQSNRESLFGGFLDKAANYMLGDEIVGGERTSSSTSISGLTSTLDRTRDALNERGEKLNALGEKSAQLVDTSADFAKMASELRKQSEGGFFW